MVKVISDVRVARSFIGGALSAVETVELDFNLGTREAVRFYGIVGTIRISDAFPSGAAPVLGSWDQSLHLEDGTVTAPNTSGLAADQFDNDDEIIYHQLAALAALDDTAGTGGLSLEQTPNGMVTFPEPIISPLNPTHRVSSAEVTAGYELLMYYDYVELSDAELGLAFARRRR